MASIIHRDGFQIDNGNASEEHRRQIARNRLAQAVHQGSVSQWMVESVQTRDDFDRILKPFYDDEWRFNSNLRDHYNGI